MKVTATGIQEELQRAHVAFELLEHRRTETAADEARALGVSSDEVAKTVVLVSRERFVRAVVPASRRLDLFKASEWLQDPDTRLAGEEELVLAYPMYELGAVPPFGPPGGDRVLIDRALAERDSVVLEAGLQRESVRLEVADLLRLGGAEVADLAAAEA